MDTAGGRLNQFPGTYSNANKESTRGRLDPLTLKPPWEALAMQMQGSTKVGLYSQLGFRPAQCL